LLTAHFDVTDADTFFENGFVPQYINLKAVGCVQLQQQKNSLMDVADILHTVNSTEAGVCWFASTSF